jgi:hypothetical protein
MLADASISRADVSKAKPPAPRPAIGHTHVGRRPQRGTGKQRRRRRRGILAAGGHHREGGLARSRRRGEEGSPPRRGGPMGGRVGEGRRITEGCRAGDGDARWGRGGRTSARLSSPTARDGVVRVSGSSDASERSGVARRRRWARRGRARQGEAAARTGASRNNNSI